MFEVESGIILKISVVHEVNGNVKGIGGIYWWRAILASGRKSKSVSMVGEESDFGSPPQLRLAHLEVPDATSTAPPELRSL